MIFPDLQSASSIISSYLPEPHAQLLNGIVFGIPLDHSTPFYTAVRHVGLLHMVVLSGTNITILSSMIAVLTTRFNRQHAVLLNIILIVIFILFVGVQAPILRAGIMAVITSVSILYGRKAHGLYTLFLTAFLMLLLKPEWLTSLSFLLSFAATFGIVLFSPYYAKFVHTSGLKAVLLKEVLPSLSAQVFTVPIIWVYFKELSLIAPLSNLLIAPFIPFLMIVGFAIVLMGSIHPALGIVPAYIAQGLLLFIMWLIGLLARVPHGFIQFH